MKKDLKDFLRDFDSKFLNEDEMLFIDGGSESLTESNSLSYCQTNNCHGGNCAAGCGKDKITLPSDGGMS